MGIERAREEMRANGVTWERLSLRREGKMNKNAVRWLNLWEENDIMELTGQQAASHIKKI